MELYELVGRLHKLELVRKLAHRKETQEYNLYFGQFPVLNFLSQHPGCTQVEIANALQVSAASIALSTKRLQKAGYIVKEVDQQNLRCKRLSLSEAGEKVCAGCHERLMLLDRKMFRGFSDEDKVTFARLLDRATVNLTEEEENILNPDVFRYLHKQLETLERVPKEE